MTNKAGLKGPVLKDGRRIMPGAALLVKCILSILVIGDDICCLDRECCVTRDECCDMRGKCFGMPRQQPVEDKNAMFEGRIQNR